MSNPQRGPGIVIHGSRTRRRLCPSSWWLDCPRDGFTARAATEHAPVQSSSLGIANQPWPTQRSPEEQRRISQMGAGERQARLRERVRQSTALDKHVGQCLHEKRVMRDRALQVMDGTSPQRFQPRPHGQTRRVGADPDDGEILLGSSPSLGDEADDGASTGESG